MQNKLWIPVLDNTKHQILDGLLLFWLYKEKNYNKPGKLVNNGATSVIAVDRKSNSCDLIWPFSWLLLVQ